MYKSRIKAYEGKEPFIFISYAHRDSDTVLPILDELADEGFRIWYDDGIAPGSEWPEYIAEHLSACAVTIAFISPNSIASPNCRREVTFALAKNKTFLGIILEPTQMSAGMEMQLSAQQCVLRYNYIDPDTGICNEKGFLEKIISTHDLDSCRELSAEQLDAQFNREAEEAAAAKAKLEAIHAARREKEAAQKAAEELLKQERELQKEERQKEMKRQKTAAVAGKAPKKKLPVLLAGILLLIVGTGILIASLGNGTQSSEKEMLQITEKTAVSKDSYSPTLREEEITSDVLSKVAELENGTRSGEKEMLQITEKTAVSKDSYSLTLREEDITPDVLSKVAELKQLRSLHLYNCSFSDADLGLLPTLSEMTTIEIRNCSGISDFSFAAGAKEGGSLTLENCGLTDASLDLSALPQSQLNLSQNPELTTLSALPAGLTELNLSGTGISDLSALKDCEQLRSLSINDCRSIRDFEPLLQLKLFSLTAQNCGIKGFSAPFPNLEMYRLDLGGNEITDVSFLNDLTRIKYLNLAGSPVEDLDVLFKSAGTLETLDVSGTGLDAAFLEKLTPCTKLKELKIDGIPINSLDFTADMSELKLISAENCGLTSVNGLQNKEKLQYLYLGHNKLQATKGLDTLDASNQIYLDLSHNELESLELPEKVRLLLLEGNDADLTVLLNNVKAVQYLVADYNESLVKSESIPACLTDHKSIYRIYILDVPNDRLLDLQERIGKAYLYTLSSDMFEAVRKANGDIRRFSSWDFTCH